MKITLLGTGAADGIPAFWGDDRVSQFAREHGGKDLRTRSAAVIDGVLKIDLPPDTLVHMHRHRLDARDWIGLVFTHSHEDHLCVSELQYGLIPFNDMDHLGCPIYGNEVVCGLIKAKYPEWPLEVIQTKSFVSHRCGKYTITPISANHIPWEEAHNLLISDGEVELLYATDTGLYGEEVYDFLINRQVNGVVIECTEGDSKTDYAGHLDVRQCTEVVAHLRRINAIRIDAPVYTTHHSARGGLTHGELEERLAPFNIVPGFDGLEFEL